MPTCPECNHWEPRGGAKLCPRGHGELRVLTPVEQRQVAEAWNAGERERLREARANHVLSAWEGARTSEPVGMDSDDRWLHYIATASRVVGVDVEDGPGFECIRCGRWSAVLDAARSKLEVIEAVVDGVNADWRSIADAAEEGVRVADLQRSLGYSYEKAVRILDSFETTGVLERGKTGFVIARPTCAVCLESGLRRVGSRPVGRPPERETIPAQLRFRVLQRDAFRCQYCGRSARDGATLHLDHVVSFAAGGETTEDNLMTACETCNLGKSTSEVV